MTGYILIWIILFVCSFLELMKDFRTVRYMKLINNLLFLLLTLMAGLRYKVGADYINYYRFYEIAGRIKYTEIYDTSRKEVIDIGYLFLNKIFYNITAHYYYFQLIYIIIIMILLKIFIEKYYQNYRNSILFSFYSLYYHRGLFALVRQALCLIILLYCYQFYLEKKERIKSISCIMVSSLFHVSSLISLSIFFINIIKKIIVPIFFISIFLGRILKPVILECSKIIGNNYVFIRRLEHYLISKSGEELFLSLGFIQKNLFFIIFYCFLAKKNNTTKLVYVYLMGVIFYNLLYFDLNLAERFSQNLLIVEIVLFPIFISLIKKLNNKKIIFLLFSFYFCSKFLKEINLYLPDYNGKIYIPYRIFLLESKIDGEIYRR